MKKTEMKYLGLVFFSFVYFANFIKLRNRARIELFHSQIGVDVFAGRK